MKQTRGPIAQSLGHSGVRRHEEELVDVQDV
jgi:hypothetical protein